MRFGRRPDENSRGVVRPSPDLLYSACPFDLSKGPLKITAHVPHSTYWSVSGFDAATNNFFVRDDQQIAGDSIEIIALRPGMALPPLDNAPAVIHKDERRRKTSHKSEQAHPLLEPRTLTNRRLRPPAASPVK